MLVLICEDDHALSHMLRECFESQGIEVLQAFTMEEARAMAVQNKDIKVVTMDGRMPLRETSSGESSTEILVEFIHQQRPDLKGRVLALAGDTEGRDRILNAGGIGIPGRRETDDKVGLIKPFGAQVVVEAIFKMSNQ